MSKSSGDFSHLDQLVADGYDPLAYRYLLLTAHYRARLKFSHESLAAAQKGNDCLQFVLLLSGDPDLLVLHLALHFEVLRFDGLNYFFCFVAFQTLLNFQLLSRVSQRRNCCIQLFEHIQGDHFIILGLPLVPLLEYLRTAGWLAE